jgi:hypothetical protein
MGDTNLPANLQSPQAQYACPHCGGTLDLTALRPVIASSAVTDDTPRALVSPRSPIRLANRLIERLFPLTAAICASATPPSRTRPISARFSHIIHDRWRRIVMIAVPFVFLLLWAIGQVSSVGTPDAELPQALPSSPTAAPAHGAVSSVGQAALLSVVTQYNAAEQQVAATLALDAIQPFVDDTGPLWQRRLQEIAVWKQTGTPHTTRLLRWSVGDIVIRDTGTTGTITTQETWEGQIGSTPPRIATVRVVYTLRRANMQAAWHIFDTTSTIL